MQIPYDLEFVENRPTVTARAITMPAQWRATRGSARPDVFDRMLLWALRVIRRFEKK